MFDYDYPIHTEIPEFYDYEGDYKMTLTYDQKLEALRQLNKWDIGRAFLTIPFDQVCLIHELAERRIGV